MPGPVRHQLVAAGAAKKQVPAADFAGLERGHTYYAYDFTTKTFWAAAALRPRQGSTPAQVSVQDNGSYDLFERPQGGSWRVFEVGAAGTGGTPCPVQVPAAVASRWDWPGAGCRPPQPS